MQPPTFQCIPQSCTGVGRNFNTPVRKPKALDLATCPQLLLLLLLPLLPMLFIIIYQYYCYEYDDDHDDDYDDDDDYYC